MKLSSTICDIDGNISLRLLSTSVSMGMVSGTDNLSLAHRSSFSEVSPESVTETSGSPETGE